MDLCQQHVAAVPTPPSQRTASPIPAALEGAILACLEKSRAKRPQTARELSVRLSHCPEAAAWSVDDSDAWWGQHERGQAVPSMKTRSSREFDATIDQS